MSLIQLLFRQQIPMVRELVCIAGAGGIILVLRAGLTGRVEELHELSEAVGNLGEKECCALPRVLRVNGRATPAPESDTGLCLLYRKENDTHAHAHTMLS